MKSGQLRCWWENPISQTNPGGAPQAEEQGLAPVYSLAMQGDALWALSGTDVRFQILISLLLANYAS